MGDGGRVTARSPKPVHLNWQARGRRAAQDAIYVAAEGSVEFANTRGAPARQPPLEVAAELYAELRVADTACGCAQIIIYAQLSNASVFKHLACAEYTCEMGANLSPLQRAAR